MEKTKEMPRVNGKADEKLVNQIGRKMFGA